MADNTRDIVIALRADVEHMRKEQDGIKAKVDEMHALLHQVRGARWAILGVAALGGFISAKLAWLLPFPWK